MNFLITAIETLGDIFDVLTWICISLVVLLFGSMGLIVLATHLLVNYLGTM